VAKVKKGSKQDAEPNELSILQIKKYNGLENLLDSEAENIVVALKLFSILAYQSFDSFKLIQNE